MREQPQTHYTEKDGSIMALLFAATHPELVQAPTIIFQRTYNVFINLEQGRYLEEHIPNAKLVEVQGADSGILLADDFPQYPELLLEFVTGAHIQATGDRAIHCACGIRDAVCALDLQVRCGVHTGECTTRDEKPTGMAVHIGARVASAASPNEVWATETVRSLAIGSGLAFSKRGVHALKGVPDNWTLHAVA